MTHSTAPDLVAAQRGQMGPIARNVWVIIWCHTDIFCLNLLKQSLYVHLGRESLLYIVIAQLHLPLLLGLLVFTIRAWWQMANHLSTLGES